MISLIKNSKERQLILRYENHKVRSATLSLWDLISILSNVYTVQEIGTQQTLNFFYSLEDSSENATLNKLTSHPDLQKCILLGSQIMKQELGNSFELYLRDINDYLQHGGTFNRLTQHIIQSTEQSYFTNTWAQSIAFNRLILDLLMVENNDSIRIHDHLVTQLPTLLQCLQDDCKYDVAVSKAPAYYLFLLMQHDRISEGKNTVQLGNDLSIPKTYNKTVLLCGLNDLNISEMRSTLDTVQPNGKAVLGFADDALSDPNEDLRLFFKELLKRQSIESMFILPNNQCESYVLMKINFAKTHKKIRYHLFKRTLEEPHLIYKDKEWHTWSTSHPIDYPDELHPSFTQPVPKTFRIHYSKKRKQYRTKMLHEIATVYSIKDWSKFRLVEHHKTTQAIEATPKQYSYRLFYTKFFKKQEVPTSLFQTAAWIDPYADFLILKHSDRVHSFVISPDEKMPIFSSSLFYKVRIHDPDRYPPLFVASYLKRPEVQSFLRNGLPEGNPHLIRKQKIEQVEIPILSLDDQAKIIADSQYYS